MAIFLPAYIAFLERERPDDSDIFLLIVVVVQAHDLVEVIISESLVKMTREVHIAGYITIRILKYSARHAGDV